VTSTPGFIWEWAAEVFLHQVPYGVPICNLSSPEYKKIWII